MNVNRFDNPLPLVADRCVFATAHGQASISVASGHHAVMAIVDGRGRVRTAVGERRVGAGDLVVTRAGDLGEVWTGPGDGGLVYDWVAFRASAAQVHWLLQAATGGRSRVFEGIEQALTGRVSATLADLRHWFASSVPNRELLLANAVERLLLLLALIDPAASPTAMDARVRRLVLHMQQSLGSRITIDELSRLAGLSPSRMTHLFTREAGMPPLRYLEDLRLERASQALADPAARVAAIAAQVGFEDPFYFTKRFSVRFGCSPTEWRQRHAAGG